MIIAPQKAFLVDFKLNNPSDTDTHYVRVVITNSVTGAVLSTLDLTDNGNKYFSKSWVTPVDVSGTGLQITMTKTVYDDPAYTIESIVYGTNVETYIVKDVASSRTPLGGIGSSGVNYEQIEKIIRKVISEIPQPEKVEFEKYDDTELVGGMGERHEEIIETLNDFKLSMIELIDNKLNSVVKDIISSKEINAVKELPDKFKEAEVSDDNLHEFITDTMNEVKEMVDEIEDKVEDYGKNIGGIVKEIKAIEKRQNDKTEMVKKIKLESERLADSINENLNTKIEEIVNGESEEEKEEKKRHEEEEIENEKLKSKRLNIISKLLSV